MIDAVRTVVFVHGVQWERNIMLQGYSDPLCRRIQAQASSTRFRFKEVLWSDVVEPREQALIAGGTLGEIAMGIPLQEIAWLILKQIFGRMNLPVNEALRSTVFTKKIPDQISSGGSLMGKAMSAILDILLYESGMFKEAIQNKVLEALDFCAGEPPPVLFGHSLGSVISLDAIKSRCVGAQPPVYGFVTAGPALGILKRTPIRPKTFATLLKRIEWVNFYDADDFLAFWNPLRKFGYDGYVQDRNINPSEIVFYSHIKYWDNSAIARELADMATTAED